VETPSIDLRKVTQFPLVANEALKSNEKSNGKILNAIFPRKLRASIKKHSKVQKRKKNEKKRNKMKRN